MSQEGGGTAKKLGQFVFKNYWYPVFKLAFMRACHGVEPPAEARRSTYFCFYKPEDGLAS